MKFPKHARGKLHHEPPFSLHEYVQEVTATLARARATVPNLIARVLESSSFRIQRTLSQLPRPPKPPESPTGRLPP